MLAKGVDVNAADQRGGVPLSRAVARDDVELAQHLIAKGASATSVRWIKHIPIFFAKSKAMVQLLLEHGAVLTGTEDNGATLSMSTRARERGIGDAVSEKGAD